MRDSILVAQEAADSNRDKKGCVGPMFRNLKITDIKLRPIEGDIILSIDPETKKIIKIQEPTPKSSEVYFDWEFCDDPNISGTGYYVMNYLEDSGIIIKSIEAREIRN